MEVLVNRSSRAFTILEVMTAVGVITLLVALTFFAHSSARTMRERMRCLNALRQWSVALAMYANEHDGAYPRSPTLYHKSPEVDAFLVQYLHISDASETSPLAACRSAATGNASLIGWTLLAGYDNPSSCQYDYTGLDMATERSALESRKPFLACMTATDGSRWISHGVDPVQYPSARPQGQVAGWPDGHARWVPYRDLEPAVIELGTYTSFMPRPNLD